MQAGRLPERLMGVLQDLDLGINLRWPWPPGAARKAVVRNTGMDVVNSGYGNRLKFPE